MTHRPFALDPSSAHLDALAGDLDDPRPFPREAALDQLGQALMNELLDLTVDTPLAEVQTILGESLIGAFHSASMRIQRLADEATDQLRRLEQSFDGSEVADVELQSAARIVQARSLASDAAARIRDAAAEGWRLFSGETWRPWSPRQDRRARCHTAARDIARRLIGSRQTNDAPRVVFRASPKAITAVDAGRIFDALNWALEAWPEMVLATSGAKGGEAIALNWARQKKVRVELVRPDFDRHGRAAPFRANEALIETSPTCVLTLASSLAKTGPGEAAFGPALHLAQAARSRGLRHIAILAR